MNRIILGLALTALMPAAFAAENTTENTEVKQVPETSTMESVDSIPALSGIDGWQAVDQDTLIVWASAAHPYLVELDRKSPDLPFVETIGITSTVGRVRIGDSVRVRGLSYSIQEIYKLDREGARDASRDQH